MTFGLATEGWSGLLRHDVIPVLSGYVVAMAILLAGRGKRVSRALIRARRQGRPPTWRGMATYLLATAVGGYAVFMAVILVYYFVLGGQRFSFIRDAFIGGAWLAFAIGVPMLVLLGLIEAKQ
jgi:hypothetical protein